MNIDLTDLFDIAVVGRACRLPGAASVSELWDLLTSGRCAVSRIPSDRWSQERLAHPRSSERGRSYTWAAGALDDIWGFDPAAFGLSPREAEQMDPQQRLLLELTWEALEDAAIKPSSLAGSEAGVFVGASALDYGNLRILDVAAADPYFATGNTLSIISNRISYAFDLHGPSFTVDTACSSGLVALNEAVVGLRSGRLDTAIVGGVNILASPFGFISFSQATMLSKTGLCQAFSAKADGYVRAEGGVVFILKTRAAAEAAGDRIVALIADSRVNSDGRTTGISLPSKTFQARLLKQIYAEPRLDPEQLAFVEAHGTGTPVGDPVEAGALGEVLGQPRGAALPIGSIKTNIGHTEPTSGLAGMLKAMLALEHDYLPASLHFEEPNPHIDFAALNLDVCATGRALPRGDGQRLAGINSFGFGGTNAHVVIADPPKRPAAKRQAASPYLVLSAHSRPALGALAATYAELIAGQTPNDAARTIAAATQRRERLTHRLVAPTDDLDALVTSLRDLPEDAGDTPGLVRATAVEREAPVAFVYSGNGGQWAGMGVNAYAKSAAFRAHFDAVAAAFEPHAGWSLTEMLHSPRLVDELAQTRVAQPLIFAIQSAATKALGDMGLAPRFVLGHSVGEVAAAEAAGIFSLDEAVRIIHFRSLRQELTRDHGTMAVFIGARAALDQLLADLPGLAVAAVNSPRAFTVSGPDGDIERLSKLARVHKARVRRLDLAYPFHSDLMAPVEAPLLKDLAGLHGRATTTTTFLSTVTAGELAGEAIDGAYWWRNVREPVRFMEAVQEAAKRGARIFIEIGPSATLMSHINDSLESSGVSTAAFCVLERKDRDEDPLRFAFASALARGARIDATRAFGPDVGGPVALPAYPWQRKTFRLPDSAESPGLIRQHEWHPLIGARYTGEQLEWHALVDVATSPYIGDHRIDGEVLLPGAAFVEMALAAAREWLESDSATVTDLEISSPMHLAADSAREVLCRISPAVSLLEIASRPRLSGSPWQTHVTAKIVREAPVPPADVPVADAAGDVIPASHVYDFALRAGLQFGPAFRQLAAAARDADGAVVVTLVEAEANAAYGLHPARLDSCFHGLILVFADPAQAAADTAYIPVRFGEVKLFKPGASIASARIDIARHDARNIIASFTLRDADGGVIASLRNIRFQAIRTQQDAQAGAQAVVQRTILASEPAAFCNDRPLSIAAVRAAARAVETTDDVEAHSADFLLLEGWATAVALETARRLATAGRLDPAMLVATRRLPQAARQWFTTILDALVESGLAEREGDVWQIDRSAALPSARSILRDFAGEHPRASAELLLAASIGRALAALSEGDVELFGEPFSASALDAFEAGSYQAGATAGFLGGLLAAAQKSWPKDRALRILQIGHGPLSARMPRLLARTGAQLTIFDPERRRLERARLAFEDEPAIAFAEQLDALPAASIDLVVCATGNGLIGDAMAWPPLRRTMAPGASFVAVEPVPSLFRDMVFGLVAARGGESVAAHTLAKPDWEAMLKAAGLVEIGVEMVTTAAGTAQLVTGQAGFERRHWSGSDSVLIVGDGDARGTETTSSFATLLASSGLHVSLVLDSEISEDLLREPIDAIVFFAGVSEENSGAIKSLTEKCMRLKRCAERLGSKKATIWVVTAAATYANGRSQSSVGAGFWAFTRTLANELPTLDIRRVDLAPDLLPDMIAERLRNLLLSKTEETEIILDRSGTRVIRFETLAGVDATHGAPAEAATLDKGETTGITHLRWAPTSRRAPEADEIEIAVHATGLNFRDVMWGLGLLPEDILEDGYAGPNFGLECAGEVIRVGADVKTMQPGDQVVAFARQAFATHVTVPATIASPRPKGLTPEAAATIPVAFLTAYYGLITCARLKPREWVLIHGGAGGVGLAALQIARWRNARIIATAGSPEKRALLTALGADHVFDSRSTAFVDDVREVTGEGVAVVLNSLSGEAMERSIGALRPFGRFVELGKRDYVANTHIGLRPFRKNLSYFGVDLDQLLLHDPGAARKLFRAVMEQFEKGVFAPLPFRAFDSDDLVGAFRLMQRSGHIGKLVVRPPVASDVKVAPRTPLAISATKTHVITGGFGGFGLETARWLVDKGARHLVLIGRSGAKSEEAKAALADFAARGVAVRAEALDVADKSAMQQLFASLAKTMPSIAGVVHGAMVLEDAALANLDAEKFERVLRPKIAGAEHLDMLTRALALDYFILFSSATTLIGNPGQGSYVAANGFLEGLARHRRRLGLPALAVSWGAIEDVGVLANARQTRETLAARAGVKTMKAREGLERMAQVIAANGAEPVVAIAPMNWGTARDHLPILKAPAYAGLIRRGQEEVGDRTRVEIAALLAAGAPDAVRMTVAGMIVEDIARVLRLPQEDVSRTSPLSEIGLDSLMAVELGLALEERFGLKGALTTSASGFSVLELADHVIGLAAGSLSGSEVTEMGVAGRHLGGDVDGAQLAAATELVRQNVQTMRDILQ
jgi:acyl transferase domain-containing protein/NADPH:quinone reductase-like Zn-dependent oxidoreductase/acyl carrier protein